MDGSLAVVESWLRAAPSSFVPELCAVVEATFSSAYDACSQLAPGSAGRRPRSERESGARDEGLGEFAAEGFRRRKELEEEEYEAAVLASSWLQRGVALRDVDACGLRGIEERV